jgi:hypothetical protein
VGLLLSIPDNEVQKPLELVCGKNLETFREVIKRKAGMLGDFMRAQKARMLIGIWMVKTVLMRLQKEIGIVMV